MLHFNSNSILVDTDHVNKNLLWYQPEEEFEFLKNKDVVDSKYLNNDIYYTFNEYGYRTKNFSDVDSDFVLIFGCSHTEGIGLHEEDIWCNQLCDKIGIDRINLGKAGSGPDIQYINSLQYIKNNFPKPKLVVIQWPQTFRRSFAYNDNENIVLKHHNVSSKTEKQDSNWFLKRYCGSDTSEMFMNNYMALNATNMMWNSIGVPVYNWSWTGDFDFNDCRIRIVETQDTGRARDMMHDGADIHKQVIDQIHKDVDKLL
jgi:hypothetical protein